MPPHPSRENRMVGHGSDYSFDLCNSGNSDDAFDDLRFPQAQFNSSGEEYNKRTQLHNSIRCGTFMCFSNIFWIFRDNILLCHHVLRPR